MEIKLDSESEPFIEYLKKVGPVDITQPLDTIRLYNEIGAEKLKGKFPFRGTKEEAFISSVDNFTQYDIPVTVLKPPQHKICKHIVIFFHGGGFTFGSRNTHMKFTEMICQ